MTTDLNRRRFLAAGALTAAGTVLPAAADAKTTKRPTKRRIKRADVVVVGAGLAGLTAARRLVTAGRSVVVLEARDRVGGRTLNHDIGGGKIVEVGGQFVGPTQDRILSLADELGVARFPTYATGDSVYIADGQATRYSGDIPPDPQGLADLAVLVPRKEPGQLLSAEGNVE